MPTPYSNFSTPDNPNAPPSQGAGQGAPANAVWDPVQQRWVGASQGPVPGETPRPPGTTWDMHNKQFVPASTGKSTGYAGAYNSPTGSSDLNGGTGSEGRVGQTIGGDYGGASWGGYSGTNVMNPDGTISYDASLNGATADIERMQGLGAAAANQKAYQIDYAQANQDALMGAQARQGQQDAIGLARSVAMGGGTPARDLGRQMLQQGVNTQQAAALSTRGGSLAQAAAMRQQQQGQAAYMQAGENQMGALRADEMAAARQQMLGMSTQQRGQDAQAQGLNQGQAINQMNQEIAQRDLNQQGQLGYEQMGQSVDKSAQDAALKSHEMKAGIDAAAALRGQRQADRDLKDLGAGMSAAGAGFAAAAPTKNTDPNDPYAETWKKYNGSDERMKQGARPLGLSGAYARSK